MDLPPQRAGAPPVSQPRQAIERVLVDGQWHTIEELGSALFGVIDPGRASRRYWRQRRHLASYPAVDSERQVIGGRRLLASDIVKNMRRSGWSIEQAGNTHHRRFRATEARGPTKWRSAPTTKAALYQARWRAKQRALKAGKELPL